MATLTLRAVKGSRLTNAEVDGNFVALNDELATKLNTSAYTASDVLSKLLGVDGAGSGLDADLLDGQHGSYYRDLANSTGLLPSAAIGGALLRAYTSADTDINALMSGSTTGTFLRAQANGHLVLGLDGNDQNDSFAILAHTATAGTGTGKPMDALLFRLRRDGTATLNAALTLNGSFVMNGGLTLSGALNAGSNSGTFGALSCSGVLSGASITNNSGYVSVYPYNGSYDDGSNGRVYWDGIQGRFVFSRNGGSGTAGARLVASGFIGDGSGLTAVNASTLAGVGVDDASGAPSTIAKRNGSGDIVVRLIRQTFANQSTISGGLVFRANDSTDNYLRVCSDVAAIRTFLGVQPSSNPVFTGLTTASRIAVGYDSGIANSINCNGWFRSSGATGWYNSTYAVGIHAAEAGVVDVYGSAVLRSVNGGSMAGTSGQGAFEAKNAGGTGDTNMALVTFHCSNQFATHLGLRHDGLFGVGGWSASTWRWYVNMANGNMVAAGDITANSDERLKRDWRALPRNFVRRLAAVKHGTYTRIDTEQRQVGVSAQSLRELLPDAVHAGEDGDTLTVAYGNAALASAVALAREVVELRRRIETLERR